MIYGEESEVVKVNRGLWYDYRRNCPTGFASVYQNLIPGLNRMRASFRTQRAAVGQRGSFAQSFIPGSSWPKNPGYIGRSSCIKDPVSFIAETNNNSPSFLYWDYTAPAPTFYKTNDGSSSGVRSYMPAVVGVTPFSFQGSIRYLDKIYTCLASSFTTGMVAVSGWNFITSAAITGANIASFPAVTFDYGITPKLLMYKGRMFFCAGTRVYYTDVPAIGLYPETWNTATNFFDLPTNTDAVVYNMFVQGDSLFMFTKQGTYALLASGLPINWIIKKVNSVSVGWPEAVCLANDVFYTVSGTDGVQAFSSYSQPQQISEPVERYLNEYDGAGVFAFEEGILLCLQKFAYVSVATGWTIVNAVVLFFNDSGWSNYIINNLTTVTGTATCSITDTAIYKKAAIDDPSSGIPSTYLSVNTWAYNGTNKIWYQELFIYTSTLRTYEGLVSKLGVMTTLGQTNLIKRLKKVYHSIYCSIDPGNLIPATINIYGYIDGKSTPDISNISVPVSASVLVSGGYAEIQTAVPRYTRRAYVEIEATVSSSSVTPVSPNVFEVEEVVFVYNTSRNSPDQVSG